MNEDPYAILGVKDAEFIKRLDELADSAAAEEKVRHG